MQMLDNFIPMEARPGLEPGCKDLQSSASPLRHRASTSGGAQMRAPARAVKRLSRGRCAKPHAKRWQKHHARDTSAAQQRVLHPYNSYATGRPMTAHATAPAVRADDFLFASHLGGAVNRGAFGIGGHGDNGSLRPRPGERRLAG